jgi:hypothetical protein
MRNVLLGVSPADPLTFAAIIALLGAVALAATVVPRCGRHGVDPLVALRAE